MKIVYLLPTLRHQGGMERVLTTKANYFADVLGYDVWIVLTDDREYPPFFPLSRNVRVVNLGLDFSDMYGHPLPVRMAMYAQKLLRFRPLLEKTLKKIKPDITVSMLRREINFLNKLKDGSIKVGEVHFSRDALRDFNFEGGSNPVKKLMTRYWTRKMIADIKKLKRFVILTEEDRAAWPELDNVEVIGNPLSFFPEQASTCQAKQVIAAGRHDYIKGFDLLIEAWEGIHKAHPDWVLKIYGGGLESQLERHKELIFQLGLQGSVFLEPPVTDIAAKFMESSIFVLSSRSEGYGLVVIEAMACGVPPVAFACCGPKAIIEDGVDGILVPQGDVKAFQDGINYLIEHDSVRKTMGRQAREDAQKFRIESIATRWADLFERLMAER